MPAGTQIPTLMLLDRVADVHLAKRSAADGWLVKPIDPWDCAAVRMIAAGGSYTEGFVEPAVRADARRAGRCHRPDDVTTADEVVASAAGTA